MILALTLAVIIQLYIVLIQRAVIRKYREQEAGLRRMWNGELENTTRLTGMYLHTYMHGQSLRTAIVKAINDFDGVPCDPANED